MRKTAPYVFVLLAALAAVVPMSAAENPQKAGKWAVTMQMEIPNMPVKMPPVKTEVCLTEEDLNNPQKSVPNDPKANCTIGDHKIDGNTVSWSMDCPKQNMKGTGRITYTGDSYTGKMDMTVGEQAMSMKYTGKWMGECTK